MALNTHTCVSVAKGPVPLFLYLIIFCLDLTEAPRRIFSRSGGRALTETHRALCTFTLAPCLFRVFSTVFSLCTQCSWDKEQMNEQQKDLGFFPPCVSILSSDSYKWKRWLSLLLSNA